MDPAHAVPPLTTIGNFKDIVRPLYMKTGTNLKQIDVLLNLRDTLLPKLINGEITL